MVRGYFNGLVNTAEVGLNLFPGFTVPGARDYVSFDAIKFSGRYSDDATGKAAELAGGFGAFTAVKLGNAAKGVAGEASSSANGARLRAQLAGQEIAGGHAFEKHVIMRGEFKGMGIRTRNQFASHIEGVVANPTASRQLSGGNGSAYWDEASRTVVIRNPRAADGGTAFQPVNGRAYFDALR